MSLFFGFSKESDEMHKLSKKRFVNELSVNGEEVEQDDDTEDTNFDNTVPNEDEQENAQDDQINDNDNQLDNQNIEDQDDNTVDDNFDIENQDDATDVTPDDDQINTGEEDTPPQTEDDVETANDTQQLNTNDTATDDVEDDFTLGDETDDGVTDNQYNTNDIGNVNDNAGNIDDGAQNDGDNPEQRAQDDGGTGGDTDDNSNFDMTGGDEGTEGEEGATDDATGQDQTTGDVGGIQGDPSDNISDEQQKESEKQLYDTLTEEQKQLRVLKLKKSYRQLYDQSENILAAVNGISKTQDNIDVLRRVIDALEKIKKLILQYVTTNYDMNTYIENYSNYIKFLAAFRTVSKVMNELSDTDGKK